METQNIKTPPTPRALRIVDIKTAIKLLGCRYRRDFTNSEIWVEHLKTGWRSYVRTPVLSAGADPVYLQDVEECWKTALNIAQGMDSDFHSGKI